MTGQPYNAGGGRRERHSRPPSNQRHQPSSGDWRTEGRPRPNPPPGGRHARADDVHRDEYGASTPPAGHQAPRPVRRPSPNRGIAPDESPTDIFRIDPDYEYGDYEEDEYYDDEYFEEDEYYDDEYYDDDDERAEPEYFDEERRGSRRTRRSGKRRRGAIRWVAALAVIALLALGAWYGARELLGFGYDDFDGAGESDVLVEVASGDSTNAIGSKLHDAGVVASPKAFVAASEDDNRVREVQPGYYALKSKMSGANAVSALVNPTARVGVLEVKGGGQFDDIAQPDGSTTAGLIAQLSKASCAQLNGKSTCVPVEELRNVAESGDLRELGVPDWAVDDASKAEPTHRLEGLIAPGIYDVRPGMNATQLISAVLKESTKRLEAAGLPNSAGHGKSPYQTLVVASLIEREAVKQDFGKVARVVYNRLDKDMKLEMDSTVNYVLDRPEVRTKPEDRAKEGPYNTYLNTGLPPTPISAPSKEAIKAAEQPDDGNWVFFVKCEKNGISCFAETNEEHEQNIREAQARGAY